MTTTGPGPEEARARAANPLARALEATANPREGALEDDAVDGVARRDRRARVIACTFATVVIPRRAKVSRARAATMSTTGRAVVALSASASWEGVFLEKNTYSSSFKGYRRNRRHDRRVVVI
jgi:hypothetical protein